MTRILGYAVLAACAAITIASVVWHAALEAYDDTRFNE